MATASNSKKQAINTHPVPVISFFFSPREMTKTQKENHIRQLLSDREFGTIFLKTRRCNE